MTKSDTATYLSSPLGTVELRGSEAGLSAVSFLNEPVAATAPAAVPDCLREAHRQVRAYFGRELHTFDLRYDVARGTDFQRQVWAALLGVGYGRTASYLDLARQLGNPGAVRAVGAANRQNPLGLVWPCHRIIGANGTLTGYAGGLWRKKWLLAFEQPVAQAELF
ncbi:methylated-DNA-[protein]-cysteine S-methyltransferase [Hymenobacter daecheongensis DSM 21074]|uniref:Methylated-DNA--protein-cysteine methyltransferase n=1 Tax=Hymenobacter daecheongensis DSM 21074 TaxID=1121955 RepID=A0A1M6AKB0_9BACT|nr:methylated-DNA--[protein]-cysteine S-methyltransferase [Hymenobacter daecheongensis]SHI36643.1 methylated-DNA-[protein]-cysteine S-methyltransferase [Hymenobacter daecheongensis DSM 21074]